MRPSELHAQIEELNRDWRSMSIVEQDRHGADYAVRFAMLAEQAIAEADRWFNAAFDRFDASQ